MLGRVTGIVCLAVAAFAPVGFANQAHAQSMDMMSILTMSNRFINPVTEYQPVSYTADASKPADSKTVSRAAAPSSQTEAKANAPTRQAEPSLRPVQKISDPR